jgi:hypothetical protein
MSAPFAILLLDKSPGRSRVKVKLIAWNSDFTKPMFANSRFCAIPLGFAGSSANPAAQARQTTMPLG